MDELERRILALETWAIEVGAWLTPEALDDAERSIRDGLAKDIDQDERSARLGALQLIEDARARFRGYRAG